MKAAQTPIERMVDAACGYGPAQLRPARPGDVAYIVYFDDESTLLHREGLPGLTPCGLAFAPIFGEIAVASGHKPGAPLCARCFPDG